MKIIYCGHGEIITAWVAGLIHLAQLPPDYVPSLKDMEIVLPRPIPKEGGIPALVGIDKNRQIYAIDLGNDEKLAFLTISGVIADSDEQWSFRDLTPIYNYLIKWGGFLGRLGLLKFGRRLIFHGIQQIYLQLAHFVFEPTGLTNDLKTSGAAVKQS